MISKSLPGNQVSVSPLPQAVGLGLDYVKLGGLSGAERMTKYNRLISIEEELAEQGILGRLFLYSSLVFFLSLDGQLSKRVQTKSLSSLSLC